MILNAKSFAAALTVAALMSFAPLAHADETTTVTQTEHHDDGPGAVITAPARAAGAIVNGVLGGPTDCSKKTVTKTDEDTGESVTKSRTDCN